MRRKKNLVRRATMILLALTVATGSLAGARAKYASSNAGAGYIAEIFKVQLVETLYVIEPGDEEEFPAGMVLFFAIGDGGPISSDGSSRGAGGRVQGIYTSPVATYWVSSSDDVRDDLDNVVQPGNGASGGASNGSGAAPQYKNTGGSGWSIHNKIGGVNNLVAIAGGGGGNGSDKDSTLLMGGAGGQRLNGSSGISNGGNGQGGSDIGGAGGGTSVGGSAGPAGGGNSAAGSPGGGIGLRYGGNGGDVGGTYSGGGGGGGYTGGGGGGVGTPGQLGSRGAGGGGSSYIAAGSDGNYQITIDDYVISLSTIDGFDSSLYFLANPDAEEAWKDFLVFVAAALDKYLKTGEGSAIAVYLGPLP